MENRLKKWLEETGYPLELKTQRILSKLGFHALNSVNYKDSELNKNREIDLHAKFAKTSSNFEVSVTMIIECKTSKKPFVHLKGNSKASNGFMLGGDYNVADPLVRCLTGTGVERIEMPKPTCDSFKMIQGFVNSDEVIHKAGHGIRKAYNYWQEMIKEYFNFEVKENNHSIAIPVLIIDSPMFSLELDEQNEMKLEPINSAIWEIDTNNLSDVEETINIAVLHIDSVAQFGESIKKVVSQIEENLEKNPQIQLKNLVNLATERLKNEV